LLREPKKYKYTCECFTCKNSRKKLRELSKQTDATAYHMTMILKELLGDGNY